MSRVTVLGSLNVDQVVSVPALPAPGQTVLATALDRRPGGKGANQAVAAARAGARVRMAAAVGADDGGALLVQALTADGVDTRMVREVTDSPTGLAIVTVQADGENTITVVPGANATVGPADVLAACEDLGEGDTLMMQLEVPFATVVEAARRAGSMGARVVLNAAPPQPADAALDHVDVLVVNEHECLALARSSGSARDAALELATRHHLLVVVTLGAAGAAWTSGGPPAVHAAPAVEAVDTTGAGDTFTGYLTAALHEGADVDDAVRLAVRAASTAVTRRGAQDGIPFRHQLAQP